MELFGLIIWFQTCKDQENSTLIWYFKKENKTNPTNKKGIALILLLNTIRFQNTDIFQWFLFHCCSKQRSIDVS